VPANIKLVHDSVRAKETASNDFITVQSILVEGNFPEGKAGSYNTAMRAFRDVLFEERKPLGTLATARELPFA